METLFIIAVIGYFIYRANTNNNNKVSERIVEGHSIVERVVNGQAKNLVNCNINEPINLLKFYLSCVEEEDKQSLTLKLGQVEKSFISPWDQNEPLFFPEASEAKFSVSSKGEQSFLTKGTALAGEVEKLFYGYPLFLDEEDYLTPLFVVEVEVTNKNNKDFNMIPVDIKLLRVNHHIFRKQHTSLEELQLIQEELEGDFGSFNARLKAAFEFLGIEPPALNPNELDTFPNSDSPRNIWINRPILFRSERSPYTYNLKRELEAFVRYERLLHNISNTALGTLFNEVSSKKRYGNIKPLIEVVTLNNIQEQAIKKGLESSITVITGPPGTGKSQVVVNLLANCALHGQPVLFASKNNKAVDVVKERLQSILGENENFTLRLGSKEKVEACKDEMISKIRDLNSNSFPIRDTVSMQSLGVLDREIQLIKNRVDEIRLAVKKVENADQLRRHIELILPDDWVVEANENILKYEHNKLNHGLNTGRAIHGEKPLGVLLWLEKMIFGRKSIEKKLSKMLFSASEYLPPLARNSVLSILNKKRDLENIIICFERIELYRKWILAKQNLNKAIEELKTFPTMNNLKDELEKLKIRKVNISQDLLKTYWMTRILNEKDLVLNTIKDYFNSSQSLFQSKSGKDFVRALNDSTNSLKMLSKYLPIWIVTSLSTRRSIPLQPALFDLVVIDEASQCDIASALPLLYRAKKAVIIGDPKQLRHISTLRKDREIQLAKEYKLEKQLSTWSYTESSIYDVAEARLLNERKEPILLAEHYRSHLSIIEFSNRIFYKRQLVVRTSPDSLSSKLESKELGVFWHDVKGRVPKTSRSALNEIEIRNIVSLLNKWSQSGLFSNKKLTFGIVTPFRLQMEKIEEVIKQQPWWEDVKGRLTVGTAHRFQGDECDMMIFSPVLADGINTRLARWVANTEQLLNVAITRARCALHVVGDLDSCRNASGYIQKFADYVCTSLSNHDRKDFESPAEKKIADLLKELGLWYLNQYEEGRYRLDFLLISPLGRRYDLEVDGRFHNTPEKLQEDEIRDSTLKNIGYEIIRIDAKDIFEKEEVVKARLLRLG